MTTARSAAPTGKPATAEKRVELPKFERVAQFRSDSFNADDNTIEIVWTTGASVRRYDWWDGTEYDEVLSTEPGAVRLERLNLGAPFLNTHSSYSLESMIGSIVPDSAAIKDGIGTARVLLSRADDVKDIVQKIREGVIRNTSVGYWIHKIVKTEADDGKVARWDVVDWEPLEVSAVPIPADPGSQIRAAEAARQRGEGPALRSCLFVTQPKTNRSASPAKPKEKHMANAKNRAKDMTSDEALAKIREAEEAAKRAAGRRAADEGKDGDEDREADDEDEDDKKSDDDRANDDADECRDDEGSDDDRAADDEDEDDGEDDKKDKDDDERSAPKGKRVAPKAKALSEADVRKAASQAARTAVEADRKRSAGIRDIAARFGLPNLGERHAGKGTSVREFKDIVLERLANRQKERGTTVFGARATDGVGEPSRAAGETKQAREFEAGAAEARALLNKA